MSFTQESNTTKSAGDKMADVQLNTSYLIPLVSALGGVVLVLSVVLAVIFCRRYTRSRRMREADDIKVKVIKSTLSDNHLESSDRLSSLSSSSNTVNEDSSLSLGRRNEQPQKLINHAPVPGLHNIPVRQNSSPESPKSPTCELMIGGDDYVNDMSLALRIVPPPPDSKCPSPPTLPDVTVSDSTAVLSTPDLPRIKGRRSKNGPLSPSLLANKEATLQRASGLFRSDTKAHEFYTKTITNYEMNRSQLQSVRMVGKGHFGCVYSGKASKVPNSRQRNLKVAIKTMKNSSPDSEKQEFLYEVEIMKLVTSLNHPNIIKLLGCVTKTQPYLIVLELMTNGNLQRFLRDTKTGDVYYNLHDDSDSITEQHLVKFALDISKGMEGIADLQLLHRDLACRNILIDQHLTCKVADFGFAKDVLNKPEYQSKSVFQRPRPTRWLPPESLFTFKHSIQSDVWSYGVVLWEIVTLGNLPYPQMSCKEVSS